MGEIPYGLEEALETGEQIVVDSNYVPKEDTNDQEVEEEES